MGYFSQVIPKNIDRDILFCSSVLNLSELLSIRPDLGSIKKKIVYFHENQLVYPVQTIKERDFQFGYNQILTCLAADKVVFNSAFDMNSFLEKLGPFFKLQPDFRPNIPQLREDIRNKSEVLYFPIKLSYYCRNTMDFANKPLHIIWPHRWEHDKNPETFFDVLFKLQDENENFCLSILGENFNEIPDIFNTAKKVLGPKILHFGWLERKSEYLTILSEADVVISTANHEFFGVAMLEAAACGCLPLVPNRLVYPELYPKDPCIYNTDNQLFKKLKSFCQNPSVVRKKKTLWTEDIARKTCEKF